MLDELPGSAPSGFGALPIRWRILNCIPVAPRSFAAISVAVLLHACSAPPPLPSAEADPSNPEAAVPPARYRSTVAPFSSRRPAEPRPWIEQNERVTPAPNSDHSGH